MAHYADTSALAKLVVAEPDSDALRAWIADARPELVAADLVRTELLRAVRRVPPEHAVLARAVLDSIALLAVTPGTYDAAGRLDPASLRSLDAIHVASALELGDDLEGFVTYDARLAAAVRAQGIPVLAPTA